MSYMPFKSSSPPALKKNVFAIDNLKGVDLFNSSSNVADYRSPCAPNMIRDVPGKVRKRMGYHLTATYTDRINGVYFLNDRKIVHAGTKLYYNGSVIYTGCADERGKSWQVAGKLYILDGKKLLCYGEFDSVYTVKTVESIAYVPIVMINRTPTGGGTAYKPINLIGRFFTDRFKGEASTTTYQLSADSLDSDKVVVKLLNSSGDWVTKTETTHFTVNRTTGVVTFITAPGVSPISGYDNIEITAAKTRTGYAEKINKCKTSILYGVNGSADRLFVTGNPDYKNYDWYSEMDDPTYFGDTWYGTIGQDSSGIVGYSIVGDYLAAHKNEGEDGRNVIMRYGTASENGEALFTIKNSIQGVGAVGSFNFAYLNEPIFATKLGLYAITAQDITGEKYSQNRSFYINKALKDEDLSDSFAFVYKDFYFIATKKTIYLLDGLQKSYERNAPYSSFQYECYYFNIPNVRVMYEENDTLCFGTTGGQIMAFYTDTQAQESYNDNGVAIPARWDLPDLDGKSFYMNKTFRYMSVRIASAIATGLEIWVQKRGIWAKLFDAVARARYFDFSYIDFGKINFSSDATPRTIGSKIKVKKVDKARFSLRNEAINEPFGIYNIAFEYTESGNFKG